MGKKSQVLGVSWGRWTDLALAGPCGRGSLDPMLLWLSLASCTGPAGSLELGELLLTQGPE